MTSAVATPTTLVRRWWRPVLAVVGIGLAVAELHGRLPSAAAIWDALRDARAGWLAAAVGLEAVSMAAFAEQQRQLLAAFGVRMPFPRTLGMTYARSAMSTAMPGGSAVSAGYAFRQYRAHGAGQPVAAAVMVLSGAASVAGLALLYVGDVLAWAQPSGWSLTALVIVASAAIGVVVAVNPGARRPLAPTVAAPPDAPVLSRAVRMLRETGTLAASVPGRRWVGVVAVAAMNWLTDLGCLFAALHATGLILSPRTVATAYLVIQLVRQVPLTPGGLGLIEASLMVAFTAAGAAQVPVAAAILLYRTLAGWSILPIGLICWTAQKAPASPTPSIVVADRTTPVGGNPL